MKVERTFDLLTRYRKQFHKADALCCKQNGVWQQYSSDDYIDYSYSFSYGLLELGITKGDKIITITNNRPEWNFADMGIVMIGAVHVPVFSSLGTSDYQYIISHSEAKLILVSDRKIFKLVNAAMPETERSVPVYSFDEIEGVKNWKTILESGKQNASKHGQTVETIMKSIGPDDFASLIYTSGTTGKAKGVMLTHRNMVSNFLAAASVFKLQPDDKFLSILPLCHVGGRLGNYQTQYSGASIYYAENMGTIAANMAELKPDGFDAVPRILEKFYDAIITKGNKLEGFKKKLFFWAVSLGQRYNPYGENGILYEAKLKIADKLIFSKWRQALGNKVRIVGCGGASLQARLERVFWAAGIKIINMYGLTETSPIITINRTERGNVRLGSVGKVIEGVQVKIAADGEILCKGPNVTPGYYRDPELTRQAFDNEGWFYTGDVGHIEDGFLMVTDRKKEIFKLSNGKFIAPQLIENIFKESPLIDQIMVIGEHEKFASALISPDFKYFDDWKKNNTITFDNNEDLIRQPAVLSFFANEIDKLNKRLSPPERLNRFRLVHHEWSPATGELSPTLKLKRQYIQAKYRDIIDQIYKK